MPQTSWLCKGDAKQRERNSSRPSAGHQELSVSVSTGNNKLLEQDIITGTHASWSSLRWRNSLDAWADASEVPMCPSGLLELQQSLQPGLSLLAGLQGP